MVHYNLPGIPAFSNWLVWTISLRRRVAFGNILQYSPAVYLQIWQLSLQQQWEAILKKLAI